MGSQGCAYDNAVAESFFATLKKELVHRRSWPTRRELISEVFEFIEAFYNTTRRHSTLGYLSPAQFETMNMININKQERLTAKARPCPPNRVHSTSIRRDHRACSETQQPASGPVALARARLTGALDCAAPAPRTRGMR